MNTDDRKLYRSATNKVVGGVCAGLADYLGTDPKWVRIAWVLLTLARGSGILLYLIALFLIPQAPPELPPTGNGWNS